MLLKILQVYGCVILYIDNFYKNVIIKKISVNSNYNLYYMYGLDGIVGFIYNNKNYYYRKNLFGDIIAIFDGNGTVYAKYVYDAWGNCTILQDTNGIGTLNPFRYRGYYYDSELNLYYLNARYYDPEIGRFISQDDISYLDPETLNGLNLFAYCLNNPVMGIDPDGTKAKWWQWMLFGIGAALVVAAAVVLTVASGGAATGLIGAIAVGAAKGALIGAAVGSAVGIAGGAIYAGVTGADMGESILSGFLMGFGIGAIAGAAIGGFAGYVSYTPSNITGFTKHGLNQVISRNGHGVNNNAILDTVKNPHNITKQGGIFKSTYKFKGSKATVILNKFGKVVTAWAKSKLGWRF